MIRHFPAKVITVMLPLVMGGWWLQANEPPPPSSVSEAVVPDTVLAGRVFVAQLPDSIDSQALSHYSAARLPLTSWLRGKSFMWATTTDDRGRHELVFDAHAADTTLRAAVALEIVVE